MVGGEFPGEPDSTQKRRAKRIPVFRREMTVNLRRMFGARKESLQNQNGCSQKNLRKAETYEDAIHSPQLCTLLLLISLSAIHP